MTQTSHVTCKEEYITAQSNIAGKYEGRISPGNLSCQGEDIKVCALDSSGSGQTLVTDAWRQRWQNFDVHKERGIFFTSLKSIAFWRRSRLHWVCWFQSRVPRLSWR